MENKDKKAVLGRDNLKKCFSNGKVPTEKHFGYLIDSVLNKQDDGISKNAKDGFQISPINDFKKFITLYETNDNLKPFFSIEKEMDENASLKFKSAGKAKSNIKDANETNGAVALPTNPVSVSKDVEADETSDAFYFHQNGNLGVGKKSEGNIKLDVNGFVGSVGRTGTFNQLNIEGKKVIAKADGKWTKILTGLNNCQAFEIVARTGVKEKGRFSLIHAVALCTYGKSNHKIRKTRAYFGFFWNRISLRWTGNTKDFNLEIKTNRNFGKDAFGNDVLIHYTICKLWDDEQFLTKVEYH